MSEVYQAPQSMLTEADQPAELGSVENAIQGNYSLQVGAVLSEAWNRVSGTKWTFQVALLLYLLVYFVAMVAIAYLFYYSGLRGDIPEALADLPETAQILLGGGMVESLLLSVAVIPMGAGIAVMGLRRAMGGQLRATDILMYYDRIIPLTITFVLLYLLLIIGFLLLVLPGIYLSIAYSMALVLVVDKKMSPWQALETSRKAVTKRWFSLCGLYLVFGIISLVSIIPLGLGFIWTIPLMVIAMGIVYRNMFGCEPETLNS